MKAEINLITIWTDNFKEMKKFYNKEKTSGQSFELAFPCDNPTDVDESFKKLISLGATPIHEPENMPWNQRTALFADPDGNIHEIFAEL